MGQMTDDKSRVAIKMVVNGQVREVTFEELAVSNNLAQEALVRLLIKKGVIDAKELGEEIQAVSNERYRTGSPPESDK